MSLDQVEAPAPSTEHAPRRRTVRAVLAVAVVVGLVAAGAAVYAATHRTEPLSAPIFAENDGLPAALVPGQSYIATLSVAVGADWSAQVAENDGQPVVVVAGLDTSASQDSPLILCSGSLAPATVLTLSCPLTAPSVPGTPVTISFSVGTFHFQGPDPGFPSYRTRTYEHTVR
jgi:hypothetical protein